MAKALIILAQDGYQDLEYQGTRTGLEEAGFEIIIASKQAGECHGKLGGTETADSALADVNVKNFDRIAFIGGPGATAFQSDPNALNIANTTARARDSSWGYLHCSHHSCESARAGRKERDCVE